ncbi:MAG: hypothetical protein L6W00_02285 [Lentisphaeria bacterium]|nr:MAG: hypothetical protein L6W00_02285 [Lentisphaeria bacterium]
MNAVGLWAIEFFFKEIKQTLQLSDFIGYNENAVRWQIWTALLTYILLRFIAWQNEWKHTFYKIVHCLARSHLALPGYGKCPQMLWDSI